MPEERQDAGDTKQDPPEKRASPVAAFVRAVILILILLSVVGVLAVILMPTFMRTDDRARQTRCAQNLKQLYMAAIQYCDDKRFLPYVPSDPTGKAAIELLYKFNYADNRECLVCPTSRTNQTSYEGFIVPMSSKAHAGLLLMWENTPHRDGKRNVVFLDGRTASVDGDTFRDLVEKTRAAAPAK
jgi:prepilin-type processing-associated H-X9-DG protein